MDENTWPRSVVVIGAGGTVGSTTAYALALGGLCRTLHLVDARDNLAQAHAIDIGEAQTLAGVKVPAVQATRPAPGSADLLILAASLPVPREGVRSGAASPNVALIASLAADVDELLAADGIVLVLTNPVDILAAVVGERTEVDRRRILGYNMNDSIRFRRAVARAVGVDPSLVHAVVLGEHGKHQVPLFSSVRIDGRTVRLTPEQQAAVRQDISEWFRTWSALQPGRSSGWCTATGVTEIVRAMRSGTAFPATAWAEGTSLPAGFVTLPLRFDGRTPVVDLRGLEPSEHQALEAASAHVEAEWRAALDSLQSLSS